jgi:hypothetical protein
VDDAERRPVAIPHLVRGVQPAARVGDDARHDAVGDGHPLLLERALELVQRVAVDPLHDEVEDVVLLPEVQDLRNVVVLDPRRDARLVQEHLLEAEVAGELGEDRLDGDELLEAVLALHPRHPDGGHAPLRDRTEELIAVEPIPRLERGRLRRAQAHRSSITRGPGPGEGEPTGNCNEVRASAP